MSTPLEELVEKDRAIRMEGRWPRFFFPDDNTTRQREVVDSVWNRSPDEDPLTAAVWDEPIGDHTKGMESIPLPPSRRSYTRLADFLVGMSFGFILVAIARLVIG